MKESHSLVPSREVKNKYNVLSWEKLGALTDLSRTTVMGLDACPNGFLCEVGPGKLLNLKHADKWAGEHKMQLYPTF